MTTTRKKHKAKLLAVEAVASDRDLMKALMNLNPAVGRAWAGRHRARGQGANHSHGACHGEDLQRRPRARGQLERVRSAHPNGERPPHRKLLKHQHLAFSEKRSTVGFRLNMMLLAEQKKEVLRLAA
jgi:hypothetical protein